MLGLRTEILVCDCVCLSTHPHEFDSHCFQHVTFIATFYSIFWFDSLLSYFEKIAHMSVV